jgi:hypothetical protein
MITQKDINKILEWCYKNNMIELNMIELKNSNLKLALTDGGWVNVIKLKIFLESIKEC